MENDAVKGSDIVFENGLQLNGLQLNGLQLNGLQLNGLQLNGLQLNGLQLNGAQLSGLALTGTQFNAYLNGEPSQPVSGTQLIGMTFNLTVQVGGTATQATARIDSMTQDTSGSATDVYLYGLSYQVAGSSTWASVCQDSDGNPVQGIPIANYWDLNTGDRIDDPSTFTFACINGAIGKCVRWGYRPWATASQCNGGTCSTVSLADYHQACTRMVRADYCGNGVGHTVDGTQIDVYDNLSPHIQSQATTWKVEARWTPDGATCLGNTREEHLYKQDKFPDCNGDGKNNDFPSCDENDYSLPLPNLLGTNYNG